MGKRSDESGGSNIWLARLKALGIEEDMITDESLHVSSRSLVCLSGLDGARSYHEPRYLQTSSLEEVKKWVGVPAAFAAKRSELFWTRRPSIRPERSMLERMRTAKVSGHLSSDPTAARTGRPGDCGCQPKKQASTDESATQRAYAAQVAWSYVYGDHESVTPLRKFAEGIFDHIRIPLWTYRTIYVESGATLELDAGVNLLVADKVVIETGGRIACSGSLTLKCSNLCRS